MGVLDIYGFEIFEVSFLFLYFVCSRCLLNFFLNGIFGLLSRGIKILCKQKKNLYYIA